MAEQPQKPGPFDVKTIEALVALMAEHDLSAIDLREGTQRLSLRRGRTAPAALQHAALSMPMQAPLHAPQSAPASPAPAAPAAPARKLVEIKSETVGTFYSAANPESPPFVRVGARVEPATVVGLLEAMKLYNEIVAGCTGVVVEILVENQQPVEFGQVLFRVDPAG